MTADVEEGLKAYLVTALAAEEQTIGEGDAATTVMACSIADLTVSLHANTGADTLPDFTPLVLIMAGDFPHVVGPLYNGKVDIVVSTPQRVPGITVASHRAIVREISGWFNLAHKSEVSEAMVEVASHETTGWFEEAVRANQEGDRWATMITLDPFGVSKV